MLDHRTVESPVPTDRPTLTHSQYIVMNTAACLDKGAGGGYLSDSSFQTFLPKLSGPKTQEKGTPTLHSGGGGGWRPHFGQPTQPLLYPLTPGGRVGGPLSNNLLPYHARFPMGHSNRQEKDPKHIAPETAVLPKHTSSFFSLSTNDCRISRMPSKFTSFPILYSSS